MYDIIIIGAGPAGLAAAIYAGRAAKKVLVIESQVCGGQIVNTLDIENYPAEEHISGSDFASKLSRQAKNLGAEIVFEEVTSIENTTPKTVITDEGTYQTKSIIIATGSENRKLGLPNEAELVGKGVSYCATCDGALYKDQTVAVIGGGNTALEDALYLADIASKVYLIHRRDEFRGNDSVIGQLKGKKNVEFILNSNVTKLSAKHKLQSIEITHVDGKTQTLDIDGLFIAIGRTPANQAFAKIINLNENGYAIASENCHTNIDGIFVAGDNRVKEVRQLVTAVSDGAVAATEASKYLASIQPS